MEWSLRHCSRPSPSLALVALLLLHVLCVDVPLPAAAAVRVGVVLDLTSDLGRKSLACISMALDDFYGAGAGAARASSSRRVVLRVRDSSGDVVTAAHAGKSAMTKQV
jgi:hypothetical protein